MATIKLITTEVGKNGSAIVMGDGAVGAAGAIAIGANAGKRQPSDPAAEPEVLGEGSIDIRTAENGIYIGSRGEHTGLGDDDTDYVVFKIGGQETKLTAAQFRALLGFDAGGKADLVGGKVPASQLPSYVDDVLEYDVKDDPASGQTAFPAEGEVGKIYVATETNKVYRWSGSQYVEIASSSVAPTLTLRAVCNDGATESDRLAVFTGAKAAYTPGETVEITVAGAVVPGTVTDYNTTKTYPFLRWSDGETNPTRTVTLGKSGDTELTAVFDVVPVATVADLKAAVANTDGNYYLQVADIDLSSESWWGGKAALEIEGTGENKKIIFGNDSSFTGVYDGGGHTISNMRLKKMEYSGLFGKLVDAVIANLTVGCLGFNDGSTLTTSWGGGILSGRAKATAGKPILIANITTNGMLGDPEHHTCHNTGGIVARVDGITSSSNGPREGIIMVNCVNNASVYCTRTGSMKFGGIIGYCVGDFTLVSCVNTGALVTEKQSLTANQNEGIGGFVGNHSGTEPGGYIIGGVSGGTITTPSSAVEFGSLVGYKLNLSISGGCKVSGNYPIYPNWSSATGYWYLGKEDDTTGYWTLIDAKPELNTDVVYKSFGVPPASSISLDNVDDYIYIDTSISKPDVTYAAGTVTESNYMDPILGIIKFTAATAE